MRYRIFESLQAEEQIFHSEDELMEALASSGWELQCRAAEELMAGRARRFRMARQSSLGTSRGRGPAMAG